MGEIHGFYASVGNAQKKILYIFESEITQND